MLLTFFLPCILFHFPLFFPIRIHLHLSSDGTDNQETFASTSQYTAYLLSHSMHPQDARILLPGCQTHHASTRRVGSSPLLPQSSPPVNQSKLHPRPAPFTNKSHCSSPHACRACRILVRAFRASLDGAAAATAGLFLLGLGLHGRRGRLPRLPPRTPHAAPAHATRTRAPTRAAPARGTPARAARTHAPKLAPPSPKEETLALIPYCKFGEDSGANPVQLPHF
ncbi:hypothetical protein BDA96_02G265500 [Sorghum bicolor]|uniref:Uncharacterized protein n=1 Tax=Sorghum bicolor TaxID=4558 RepID=A0A921RQL1_SORBI|nr:hypothetical protein BDA96_02G265500 [Sorghum bicolor]